MFSAGQNRSCYQDYLDWTKDGFNKVEIPLFEDSYVQISKFRKAMLSGAEQFLCLWCLDDFYFLNLAIRQL